MRELSGREEVKPLALRKGPLVFLPAPVFSAFPVRKSPFGR